MLHHEKKFENGVIFFKLDNEIDHGKNPLDFREKLYLPSKLYLYPSGDGISYQSLKKVLADGFSGASWLLTQVIRESDGSFIYDPHDSSPIEYEEYMPCGIVLEHSLDFPVVLSVRTLYQYGSKILEFTIMPKHPDSIQISHSYGPTKGSLKHLVTPFLRVRFWQTRKGATLVSDFELHISEHQIRKAACNGFWRLEEISTVIDACSFGDCVPLKQRLTELSEFENSRSQSSLFPDESQTHVQNDSVGHYVEVGFLERIFLNLLYALGKGLDVLVDILDAKVDSYKVLEP